MRRIGVPFWATGTGRDGKLVRVEGYPEQDGSYTVRGKLGDSERLAGKDLKMEIELRWNLVGVVIHTKLPVPKDRAKKKKSG